jgi:hypothetical protein
MDRIPGFEPVGCRFESCRLHQIFSNAVGSKNLEIVKNLFPRMNLTSAERQALANEMYLGAVSKGSSEIADYFKP